MIFAKQVLLPGHVHGSTVIAQAAVSQREGADMLAALWRGLAPKAA